MDYILSSSKENGAPKARINIYVEIIKTCFPVLQSPQKENTVRPDDVAGRIYLLALEAR
jgi:hypothetical protein